MSKYAHIEGELHFRNDASRVRALRILEDGGWITDGAWLDETGAASEDLQDDRTKLVIPRNVYRNLIHRLSSLTALANVFDIVWASTDGDFTGGIISSGGCKTIDLYEWAKESFKESAPVEDECDSSDEYQENLINWQEDVLEAFMADPKF